MLWAEIENWELAMVMGNIRRALLTVIALFWLKKALSNLSGSCTPLGRGSQPWNVVHPQSRTD